MQLSKFSVVVDYLPGRQFPDVDRSTMKHDSSHDVVTYAECSVRGSELLFELKHFLPWRSIYWVYAIVSLIVSKEPPKAACQASWDALPET